MILPATTASFCRCKSLLHCLSQQPLTNCGDAQAACHSSSTLTATARVGPEGSPSSVMICSSAASIWAGSGSSTTSSFRIRAFSTAADISLLVTGALAWQQVARSEQQERHLWDGEALTPCVDHNAFQRLWEVVNTLLSGLNWADLLPTSAPVPPPRGRPSSGLTHPARIAARSTRKTTCCNPGRDKSGISALPRLYRPAAPRCCATIRML